MISPVIVLLISQSSTVGLTLAEVVKIASAESKEVQIADRGVAAADARTGAARANLFPKLKTEGNIFVWDRKFEVDFGGGMPITIRNQVTGQVSVSVVQPLTALFTLLELVEVESLGRDVAEADRDRARLDATQRAVEAFLRTLQARAVVSAAERSLQQVDAQLEVAKALEKAGVLGTIDLLRIEAARANGLQLTLRARANVAIADGALALALDWPQGTEIRPVDDLPDPPPKVTLDPEIAKKALQARPELASAGKRIEQATIGKKAVYAAFVPNIAAIGTYTHVEGQSTFAQRDAAFGGAVLSWDLSEWLKTFAVLDEAQARLEQAQLGAEALEQAIEFDVQRRSLDAKTIYETLSVAQSGLRASEEAYRIQSARYQQGAATTTDLLDAETDLARARVGYAAARYEYYVALAGLARALGRVPAVSPAGLGE